MPIPIKSGLVLQLETDSGITVSGGKVTAWKDASGKGNHLTGAGDPTLSGTTPTGAAVIDFDGAGDKLERVLGLNGLPSGNANRTIFFVVDYVSPQGVTAGAAFGDNQGNQTFGLVTSAGGNLMVQGYGGPNDFISTTNGVNGGFLVQSAVLSNGTLKQYKNGGLIDTDSHAFNTDLERLVLGEEIGGKGFSAMKVGAMVVFNRALTDGERGQVETYLKQKYVGAVANTPPVANDDTLNIATGATGTINVLTNDSDNAPLNGSMIAIVDGPDKGTITGINATTGAITYKHTGNGDDSFTYKLTDGNGAVSNVATVTVDVPSGTTGPFSLAGFSDELVINRTAMGAGGNQFQPISMAFTPDNRLLLLSKTGEIRIVDPETGANAVLMKLNNIDSGTEKGLLDITLDPNFETNGHFYLYYTPASPQHARISRFTFQENSGGLTSKANLSSELKIWEDTDGYLACCHYGGGLDFGVDGKIWLTTSDKFQSTTPGEGPAGGKDLMLDLTSSSGKIIRVNKDGSIPSDNPFVDGPGGKDDSIWAYGLRNPFRARWDAEYGQMYIGEVGGNQQNIAHDDLHLAGLGQKGAFYGWPFYEGTTNTPVNGGNSPQNPNNFPKPDNDLASPGQGDLYSAPIWSLAHKGTNASLTGGEVYRGDMFPAEWDGVYFYGDYTRDYIRYLVLNANGTKVLGDFAFKPSTALPGTTNEVVSITVGADGALYYAMIASGVVRRVVFEGDNAAPKIVAAGLSPTTGDLPLAVTFTATVTDADGDAMTWKVNFGDGTIKSGTVPANGMISVPYTYTTNGAFKVSLTLSDGSDNSLSTPINVSVGENNDAPVITGESSDLSVGGAGTTEITFTATATDADGDSLSYVWHFGDGTTAVGTVGAGGIVTASHVYAEEGSYSAHLEVTDGADTTSSEQLPIQIGTATQVPVTNGLVLLLQSDIKIGLGTGNTVTSWLDGSGNGNNLFAKGNPKLVADQTPTGEPAIVFDGVGDLLQRVSATDEIFNLPTGNADRSIFFVVDYVAPEGVTSGVAYGDGAANEAFGLVAGKDGKLMLQGYGAANDFPTATEGVTGGFMVHSAVLKNGVISHYKNGALIDNEDHTFATDLKKLVLGAEIKALGESQLKIGAVLIYDRAVTESQRGQIEAFLQKKYITDTAVAANDAATTGIGTATLDKNGTWGNRDDTIIFTSDAALPGSDSFNDSHGDFDPATVNVTATGPTSGVPVTSGLVAAYQADENVSFGSGTTVQGWLDGSGRGNNLVAQGNPQLVAAATPTGQPAIAFDGSGDLLQRINATDTLSGFAAGTADRTMFFVVDYVAPEGVTSGLVYGDAARNEGFGLDAATNGNLMIQGVGTVNDFMSMTNGVTGDFLVQSAVLDDHLLSHYQNGSLIDTDTHTFNTDLKKLVLGAEIAGAGESQMEIAAAFIYNRALSEPERLEVEAYLQDKFIGDDLFG